MVKKHHNCLICQQTKNAHFECHVSLHRRIGGSTGEEWAMAFYIALLNKTGGDGYSIRFPDFPGMSPAGATIEETVKQAENMLASFASQLRANGKAIRAPSNLDAALDPQEQQQQRESIVLMIPLASAK
jgi:predicted RNase H-like HicB family nuclease